MRWKDNYVMVKRAKPKQVTLTDDRTFTARYERVFKDRLSPNVTIRRRYKQRAAPKNRRRQAGRGLPKAFSGILKIVRSTLFRTLGTVALKNASVIYDYA